MAEVSAIWGVKFPIHSADPWIVLGHAKWLGGSGTRNVLIIHHATHGIRAAYARTAKTAEVPGAGILVETLEHLRSSQHDWTDAMLLTAKQDLTLWTTEKKKHADDATAAERTAERKEFDEQLRRVEQKCQELQQQAAQQLANQHASSSQRVRQCATNQQFGGQAQQHLTMQQMGRQQFTPQRPMQQQLVLPMGQETQQVPVQLTGHAPVQPIQQSFVLTGRQLASTPTISPPPDSENQYLDVDTSKIYVDANGFAVVPSQPQHYSTNGFFTPPRTR